MDDDNFLYVNDEFWRLAMIIVKHVDDVLLATTQAWIEWFVRRVEEKFGKAKRHCLPLM